MSLRNDNLAHGNGFMRLIDRLREAFAGAVRNEVTRATDEAEKEEDQPLIDSLPEPPHLEPGELKYGNGMHDYF